jgi:hypothetical protein
VATNTPKRYSLELRILTLRNALRESRAKSAAPCESGAEARAFHAPPSSGWFGDGYSGYSCLQSRQS